MLRYAAQHHPRFTPLEALWKHLSGLSKALAPTRKSPLFYEYNSAISHFLSPVLAEHGPQLQIFGVPPVFSELLSLWWQTIHECLRSLLSCHTAEAPVLVSSDFSSGSSMGSRFFMDVWRITCCADWRSSKLCVKYPETNEKVTKCLLSNLLWLTARLLIDCQMEPWDRDTRRFAQITWMHSGQKCVSAPVDLNCSLYSLYVKRWKMVFNAPL